MIARLQRLERIRKRQRQQAVARLQQLQQHEASVQGKLDDLHDAASGRAATGARAGELQAWSAGAVAVGRELERVREVVRRTELDVQGRAFAHRRAELLLERARDERQREQDERQQREADDRASARRSS